jgi:hypothetical protein
MGGRMMDWQQPASLAVVALAGFLFVRHEIRSRRRARSRACGSDCGCGGPEDLAAKSAGSAPQKETSVRGRGSEAP